MVKSALAEVEGGGLQEHLNETAETSIEAGAPLASGLDILRSIDPDALRVWSVKGPKHAGGGELMGVLLRTSNEVVLIEQRASGRFTFYRKASAAEIESSLD